MEIGKGEQMNIKIVGAVLIIFACGGCGFMLAAHYTYKIRMLHDLSYTLEFMICELQYRVTPLPQLCRAAGEQSGGKIGKLLLAFSNELEAQISPNAALCMATVLERSTDLDIMTVSFFTELGNHLGRFDLPGQIRGLEKCMEDCKGKLERLNKDKDSRLRSYQTLGLCAGAAIAILFV